MQTRSYAMTMNWKEEELLISCIWYHHGKAQMGERLICTIWMVITLSIICKTAFIDTYSVNYIMDKILIISLKLKQVSALLHYCRKFSTQRHLSVIDTTVEQLHLVWSHCSFTSPGTVFGSKWDHEIVICPWSFVLYRTWTYYINFSFLSIEGLFPAKLSCNNCYLLC